MSTFDPTSFLDATITEANKKRNPIPAGVELVAIIGELKSRTWVGKADPTKGGIVIDVPLEIDLSATPYRESVGVDKVTLSDGIMLDTLPGGGLDNSPGKNGKLRRYREALGMNTPGEPFSIRMMQGRMIKVKIKNEPYEGEIYDKVDSVAKA